MKVFDEYFGIVDQFTATISTDNMEGLLSIVPTDDLERLLVTNQREENYEVCTLMRDELQKRNEDGQ